MSKTVNRLLLPHVFFKCTAYWRKRMARVEWSVRSACQRLARGCSEEQACHCAERCDQRCISAEPRNRRNRAIKLIIAQSCGHISRKPRIGEMCFCKSVHSDPAFHSPGRIATCQSDLLSCEPVRWRLCGFNHETGPAPHRSLVNQKKQCSQSVCLIFAQQ